MEYKGRPGKSYFKVVLVRLSAGEYVILKGPEEEKRLARVLQNDYNITKYEKMIQLLAMEMVQKEYREGFCSIFSIENISKGLREEGWSNTHIKGKCAIPGKRCIQRYIQGHGREMS